MEAERVSLYSSAVTGSACPNDPQHQLQPVSPGRDHQRPQLYGVSATGERVAVASVCPECSKMRTEPAYFGVGRDGSPVELVTSSEVTVDHGAPVRPKRRLTRTIVVGVLGLAVVAYLATVYSWFDSSIWGGIAFFVLFAAVAMAYQADDNAARRRRAPQDPST